MPSLFSRSRTNSTPQKKLAFVSSDDYPRSSPLDEFGRVSSRVSNGLFATPGKKDKKKAKEQEKRLRAISTSREPDYATPAPLVTIPDGSFLPFNLERPRDDSGATEQIKGHDYGYLSYERHVVLGLDQVSRLVDVVSEELCTRGGITTPFIFSTTALDISSSAIKRLIQTFINTCIIHPGHGADDAERKWREEARFAGPHELGMCLRWGLARVSRVFGDQELRGLIAWDHYTEWRDSEAAHGFPPSYFETFLTHLAPPLRSIILTVLTLLIRLTANSTTSGHTPPTLSPLFGPLLFGLGPATLAFHHTYVHYLRAVNAMEHILLAFIRWEDNPRTGSQSSTSAASGSAAGLGVPTRLKEWIKGYPSMLPFLHEPNKKEKPQPRRGVRTVRVMSVRRNVRMYSSDLVKTAASWAHRSTRYAAGGPDNGLSNSKEWERIAPSSLKLPPRYSEAYKKRMDLPHNFHPDTGPGTASHGPIAPSGMSSMPSTSSYTSTVSTAASSSLLGDQDYFGLGLGAREGEDRFRSLTDLKWGEFESMGFGGLGDEKKLQFDLTEGARSQRSAKRATLTWTDFSSSGFTRTDAPLSATLQFSAPVTNSISTWPAHHAEMSKKLKKSQKALPAFGWDTEPVVGSEEVIEEAFVDVFCDLVYGGGWMDLERVEEHDRDCNWALIEFKSLPASRSTVAGGSDPRTATSLILFEEFVPLEYRQQLAETSTARRRLPFFSPSGKSKQWKQAATLNGRPYVVGHVPRSPSYREVEFEGLLRGGAETKVISLGAKHSIRSPAPHEATASRVQSSASTAAAPDPPAPAPAPRPIGVVSPLYIPPSPDKTPSTSEEMHSDSTVSPSAKRPSRFRLPGGIPVPSPGGVRKSGMPPSEYSTVEFETRLASYSDDEYTGVYEPEAAKQRRRESTADAWVDILVGSQSRRLGGQDAELKDGGERRRGVRGRGSDPELASLEAAQVLAAAVAVRGRSPSLSSVDGRGFGIPGAGDRVDRDYGMDQHVDEDVDEIETVPRTSGAGSSSLEYATEPEVEADEGGPVLSERQMARQQRRLGYFDLHPERRPGQANPVEEDPRDRLAYEDSDGDGDGEEGDDGIYGSPENQRLAVPPKALRSQHSASREYLPLPLKPLEVFIPEFDPAEERGREEREERERERERARKDAESVVAPSSTAQNGHGSGNGNGNGNGKAPDSKLVTPSKTAALIEMYRERERGTSTSPSPKPPAPPALPAVPVIVATAPLPVSRLPVRSSSLAGEGGAPVGLPVSPKPSPTHAELDLIEPPRVPLEESGRASPARYVHGAPLHNVLEEEEEE